MPVRKGYLAAPQNIFIDTVIKKYDGQPGRNFVIGNALSEGCPIIYVNSSFCELTGFNRHELVQQNCLCNFLHGPDTDREAIEKLEQALKENEEREMTTYYYKKSGERFLCSVVVVPIKSENGEVFMYMINHNQMELSELNDEVKKKEKASSRKISQVLLTKFKKVKGSPVHAEPNEPTLQEHPDEEDEKHLEEEHDLLYPGRNSEWALSDVLVNNRYEGNKKTIPCLTIMHTDSNDSIDSIFVDSMGLLSTPDDNSKRDRILSSSMSDLRSNGSIRMHLLSPALQLRSSSSDSHLHMIGNSTDTSNDKQQTKRFSHQENERERHSFGHSFHAKFDSLRSLMPTMKPQLVAQVMSLGSDILPEYKVESPKIHPWTILHYSPFKAIWDWVVLFLVMYTAIITPYMAAFVLTRDNNEESVAKHSTHSSASITIADDPLVILDYIVDVMFIIDIFINFRTTFVDVHDEVVSDPCRVAIHYMKGWFVVDLVAAIPFELLIMIGNTDQTTTLIGLLKTARLLRLVRVARKLDRYSEYGTALLMLLMFGFALVAHWLACVWYAIGNFERHSVKDLGWLTKLGQDTNQPYNSTDENSGPDIETKYLTALYFTLSSLTSVGFGNVSANTNGEKIFSIIIMLVGALMHAVIFGNVTAIIQRLYSGMAHYHSTMRRVREFIRFYQIPSPLRQRLEDYAQYDYSYTNGIDMNEVLRNFPEGLQADISLHLNRHLLSNNPAFRGCTPGCLRSLSLKLTTTHCPPGDYIIHYGDEISSLYWIGRGTVEIIQNDTIIAILGKGDSFGENFGLTAQRVAGKAKASVRALTYCDLHSISKDNLIYIMQAYPEFRRTFNVDLQITYDLRDAELEEKDINSSLSNLPLLNQCPGQRTPTRTFDRLTNFNLSSPCRTCTTRADSFTEERPVSTRATLDAVSEYGGDSSVMNSTTTSCSNSKRKKRNSFSNNATQCGCSHELRREVEDIRSHLYKIETIMKEDMKTIVELLKTRSQSYANSNDIISNNHSNHTGNSLGEHTTSSLSSLGSNIKDRYTDKMHHVELNNNTINRPKAPEPRARTNSKKILEHQDSRV